MQRIIRAVRRTVASLASTGRRSEGQAAKRKESSGPAQRKGNAAAESIELSGTDKIENPHEMSGLKKYALGEFTEAVVEFDRAIELEPENADAYVMRAIAKDQVGLLEEAIEDFNRALGIEPDNGEIYVNRGVTKHGRGETESALADLDRAVRLQPDFAPAFFKQGRCKGKSRPGGRGFGRL